MLLKHTIAGVRDTLPILWTCEERFASNIVGVFEKELPCYCKPIFIPIENVDQKQAELFDGIDFSNKNPTEN